jgi:hypothetical protein
MKTSNKSSVQKIKAWAIVNKKDPSDVYAAYVEKSQVQYEIKTNPGFHKNDVIRECIIILPKKKNRGV